MNKLTLEEWNKLTRDEKRQVIIEFREPENIRVKERYISLEGDKI